MKALVRRFFETFIDEQDKIYTTLIPFETLIFITEEPGCTLTLSSVVCVNLLCYSTKT